MGTSVFDNFNISQIPIILTKLGCYFIQFALILLGIVIIISGISFVFSRGNPTALANAKKAFYYSIVGGLVSYGVYTIILSVNMFVTGSATLSFIPLAC